MKKLFLLTIIFLLSVTFTQGQKSKTLPNTFTGEVVMGIDNTTSQHTLYVKAKQWADNYYERGTAIIIEKNKFTVWEKDYNLLLEFKDGIFKYSFISKNKIDEVKGKVLINELTEYVKNTQLADNKVK